MDLSHLDKKYFIDPYKYNCPFCKRNHVSYDLNKTTIFDWTDKKKCYAYFITCNSCKKESVHFCFSDIRKFDSYYQRSEKIFKEKINIDEKIFFSQPSSYFTLDERISAKIRELVFEAEKSRQANLLVGSSACIRKAIYEILKKENTVVKNEKTGRTDYQTSIKSLKSKFKNVSSELFDALSNIQELASDPLHEDSWDEWDSPKLNFLIELIKSILNEMYVIPAERKKGLGVLAELKKVFKEDKKEKKE